MVWLSVWRWRPASSVGGEPDGDVSDDPDRGVADARVRCWEVVGASNRVYARLRDRGFESAGDAAAADQAAGGVQGTAGAAGDLVVKHPRILSCGRASRCDASCWGAFERQVASGIATVSMSAASPASAVAAAT